MAGVGIELQASFLKRRSYLRLLKIFGYATSLAGGPWLVASITVALLCVFGIKQYSWHEMTLFAVVVMYAFAGSVLFVSPFALSFGRYLADQTFVGRLNQRRMFLLLEAVIVPLAAVTGYFAARHFLPDSVVHASAYRLLAAALFTFLAGLWPVMTYLDFRRRLSHPMIAFVAGSLAALASSWWFRRYLDSTGYMAGFTLGMGLIYAALFFSALHRPVGAARDLKAEKPYLEAARPKFAALILIGVFYNLGIWMDKFVIWSTRGTVVWPESPLRVLHVYDIATFMAYLLLIPGIAYFLLVVESSFYEKFREYLAGLESDPYHEVEEKRAGLVRGLFRQAAYLAELQAILTVIAFFIGPALFRTLGLPAEGVPIYRVLIWAASFQVMLWMGILLLLYFEFRREALLAAVGFCFANTVLTYASLNSPGWVLGWGYALSALAAGVFSLWALHVRLKDLHRHIFRLHFVEPPPVLDESAQG